jgi:hypothetical protein
MFTDNGIRPESHEDKASESFAESVAWWLLTGSASPTTTTRFIHAGPAASHVRTHVATQVEKVLEAAATAEIHEEVSALFLGLLNGAAKSGYTGRSIRSVDPVQK